MVWCRNLDGEIMYCDDIGGNEILHGTIGGVEKAPVHHRDSCYD